MTGFDDYRNAASFRDMIREIVAQEIEQNIPPYRYGVVQTVNTALRTCTVLFSGDDFPVTVRLGSRYPTSGQVVRVAGKLGDRYVDDTMGSKIGRFESTGDVSLTSTSHALQIGSDTGLNLIADQNEIQARLGDPNNPTVASGLYLNKEGGDVYIERQNSLNGTLNTLVGGNAWAQAFYNLRIRLMGGGLRQYDGTEVSWTSRFIAIAQGRNSVLATDGHFGITMPAAGTTILINDGSSSVQATATGVPLAAWQSLWYKPPHGSANTTVPGNFRIVSYLSNYQVPNDYVFLCGHLNDGTTTGQSTGIMWADGVFTPGWTLPTLPSPLGTLSGWGAVYYYKTPDQFVHIRGSFANSNASGGASYTGSSGSLFTLPVGFRPVSREGFVVQTGGGTFTRLDVLTAGTVILQFTLPAQSSVLLGHIQFMAGN